MEINTEELIKRTGISRRQLNYWLLHDVFQAREVNNPGSGYYRTYDEEIVDKVSLLVKIAGGFSLKLNTNLLKKVYDNYDQGSIEIADKVSLNWR